MFTSFDAPIEYIAATQEWADATGEDWRRWWRTDAGADDVRYVEFMGKDNVAFHTAELPAGPILVLGEPWKTVDVLEGVQLAQLVLAGKFSTKVAAWRRSWTRRSELHCRPTPGALVPDRQQAPEHSDTGVHLGHLPVGREPATLPTCWGNFVNRIAKFCETRVRGGPAPAGGEPGAAGA